MYKPFLSIIILVSFVTYILHPLHSLEILIIVLIAFALWYFFSRKVDFNRKEKKEASPSRRQSTGEKVIDLEEFRKKRSKEEEEINR